MEPWEGKNSISLAEPLTRREREILALLAEGLTGPEIAARLTLATSSVKTHMLNLYGKLGANRKRQALLRAQELGLLGSAAHAPISSAAKFISPESLPHPSVQPRHNLPRLLTRFIGRTGEIAQVKNLLEEYALVSLTGSGGVGKTRLALCTAQSVLGEYADGVWLVELASLADPGLVPQAVAAVFGVQEGKDYTLLAVLANTLRDKRILLVLDNCEHLVEACAALVGKLLQVCPNLQVLATSRESLGVDGEINYPVPPLAFPDPSHLPPAEDLCQYEAACLYIERARTAWPGFAVTDENAASIARICQRLDGIPLAIELAAARVRMLDVNQIAARLEKDFRLLAGGHRSALPRHQTVRVSIEWSYHLLTEAERVLLRRLSVFAGGWTLEAAEAVGSGDDLADDGVLDLLTQLANKSLVIVEHGQGQESRYRLLEVVRQYAGERLAEAGEVESTRDCHLAYFLYFAEAIEPKLMTAQRLEGLNRLRVELDNLRAALRWSLDRSQSDKQEKGLCLATGLRELWMGEGLAKEGLGWLEKGLVSTNGETPAAAALRAKGLHATGTMLLGLSEFTRSRQVLEESISLFRQSGDRRDLSLALSSLAQTVLWLKEYSTAYQIVVEAVEIARQSGDRWTLAYALVTKSNIACSQNDLETGRATAEESLALFLESGDQWTAARSYECLGFQAMGKEEYEAARSHFLKCLEASQEAKDKFHATQVFFYLGKIAYYQEEYRQTEAHFQASLDGSREISFKIGEMYSLHHAGIAVLRQGEDRRAAGMIMESLDMAFDDQKSDLITQCLNGMAGIAVFRGQLARAARLFGAIEAIFEVVCAGPFDLAERERGMTRLHAQMDEGAFQTAWGEGRGLTLEQAVQEARAVCESEDFGQNL